MWRTEWQHLENGLLMTKVCRRVVHDGDAYLVECAVRADGITSLVADFLDQLKEKTWSPESDGTDPIEPDEQLKAYTWLLAKIAYFADEGDFPSIGNRNQLMNGIWEIKRWHIRITFYDTDGHGSYTPKITQKIHTGGGGYFPLPDFDPYIRLGTVFTKTTQKTPHEELDFAEQIRKEDLAHDREH